MSSTEDVILEDDFICLRFKNNTDNQQVIEREKGKVFFCLIKGVTKCLYPKKTV